MKLADFPEIQALSTDEKYELVDQILASIPEEDGLIQRCGRFWTIGWRSMKRTRRRPYHSVN
jgi:hypothetical protein